MKFSQTTPITAVLTLIMCVVGVSLSTLPISAQTLNLILNHLKTAEATDQVTLDLYFTPVEPSGRPFTDQLDTSGSVQLLGEGSVPIPATVQKPHEPIYITFLLDTSGSMAPLMSQVQTAAIAALEETPPNAHFAVIQFNDVPLDSALGLTRDFTTDRNLIEKDIRDAQATSGAPTCLYNATDKAIELLRKRMQPQERGAIILFTDGRDERANGSICSNRTIDDVLYSAVGAQGIDIPVHTIGLCTDNGCGNLDRAALTTLAKETTGFSAIGSEANLNTMFQQIMAGLNSQWMATATVYPRRGKNDAVLKVRTGGQAPFEFTTTFIFDSTIDTRRPAPPAVATIDKFGATNATSYEFSVSVNSADPNSIEKVIVQTYSEQNTIADEKELTLADLARPLQLNATRFTDGEYTIQVKAVDLQHNFIPNLNDEGEFVLAEWDFTYQAPPEVQAPIFTIRTVDPLYHEERQAELAINIDVPSDQGADLIYEGFIRVKDGGGSAGKLDRDLLKGTEIVVPLPAIMLNQVTPIEYTLHLTLRRGNEGESAEQTYDFTIEPARQPGRVARFGQWVRIHASWLLFIISTALALLFWRIIKKRRELELAEQIVHPERNEPTIADVTFEPIPIKRNDSRQEGRPNGTVIAGDERSIAPRLLVQTVRNQSQTQPMEQELRHFPCVVGRNDKLAHGQVTPMGKRFYLNLLGDAKISGKHLEIQLQGGQFYVVDLESRNKTKLNGQLLTIETPIVVDALSELQLGPDTRLEIQPFT